MRRSSSGPANANWPAAGRGRRSSDPGTAEQRGRARQFGRGGQDDAAPPRVHQAHVDSIEEQQSGVGARAGIGRARRTRPPPPQRFAGVRRRRRARRRPRRRSGAPRAPGSRPSRRAGRAARPGVDSSAAARSRTRPARRYTRAVRRKRREPGPGTGRRSQLAMVIQTVADAAHGVDQFARRGPGPLCCAGS